MDPNGSRNSVIEYHNITKVIVLIKLNNILLKALATTLLTAATTLRLGNDTSIVNTNLQQPITVG